MKRLPLVAGNWKMHGSLQFTASLISELKAGLSGVGAEVVICPPFPYLSAAVAMVAESPIKIGAQNLSEQTKQGAFTGEVLGAMLADVGCNYVIVGHSERRAFYGDTDAVVAQKVAAALAAGLTPIFCVGETLEQRESGQTETVINQQLDAVLNSIPAEALESMVIAYEPVWAIGTGRTASAEQAQAVHANIRGRLSATSAKLSDCTRILYGGSVKPDNAAAIFSQPDVDGGLIGGAALKATDFLAICAAAQV